MADDLPILPFASAAEMEEWLEGNHAGSDGIWLKIGKEGSGIASVTHAEALELALCLGWIDSQKKRGFDERFFLQRFTPRQSGGKWSRINREKAEALIACGAMRPAGLAARLDRRTQLSSSPRHPAWRRRRPLPLGKSPTNWS